jgi:DNA mismatch endonuclease (patch repair protein)
MSRIRSSNTVPEKRVRKLLHGLGYRFRLHRKDLPGTPDIVLASYSAVVFVHGCFWHRHRSCRDASTPKTRRSFWREKFSNNVNRDRKTTVALRKLGWKVLIVWECELKDEETLATRLSTLLSR